VSGSLAGLGRLVVGRVAGLVVVVSLWVLLVVGAGGAWATTGHTFAGQFGGLGDGDGQFGEPLSNGPAGVAVMASTGEVFTADAGSGSQATRPRVQRFSADGTFASSFALDPGYAQPSAVAVNLGSVYVAILRRGDGASVVLKYAAGGVFVSELDVGVSGVSINSAPALAVDPVDGTVYVSATDPVSGLVVAGFDPVTGLLDPAKTFDGSSTPETAFSCSASGLAVDGLHRVYVLDPCKNNGLGRVDRFGASGVFEASVDAPASETLLGVAADPVLDQVYVAHSGPVGVRVTHLGAGGVGVVYGFDAREAVAGVRPGVMAVSGAGQVYLSDSTRAFVVRYSQFEGPTVMTGAVSSVQARSAVFEGTIDPEGVASTYHFEYSTDLSFGSRTPDVDAGSGNGAVAKSATVTGLRPNTNYNFRIVGSNASGSIAGAPVSFPTLTAPPNVDGTPIRGSSPAFASAIGPRSARLHGTVNPNSNFATYYRLEYGTTTAYGKRAVDIDSDSRGNCFGCGGDDIPVIASVSGLEPGTTYHFRVVADTDDATLNNHPQFGTDQTFVTAPAAGGGATGVTSRRARLTGTIDPHGVATSYHFNYGPTSSYGESTPEADAGAGDGEQQVPQDLSGLVPDTSYHVQVVATSSNGVVRSGADGLFRTAPAPTAVVIGPTGVSTDAATLAGEVNTFGLTGSYHFDVWSLDSAYAVSTPMRPVSGSAGAGRVGAALVGLPAGETFVVQLTVDSNDSVSVSDMDTFATAAVPKVFPVSPTKDPATIYGCGSPRLNAYNGKPKPGDEISITGQDLGVGGSVMLGDRLVKPVGWSAGGFRVVVPEGVVGTLGLTVNCGRVSNTIAVTAFVEPDNRFSIPARSVVGSTAVLRVRVPGPGKIESSGASTQAEVTARAAKVTVKEAATATVKVILTSAGRRALGRAKSHTLKVKVRVRFTPAGGRAASKTVTVTFKRGSGL
jgi:hypothetical protein